MELDVVITCEHAGKVVPDAYSHHFAGAGEILNSHRGWDPGAMEIALHISSQVKAPFFKCEATRLLVEPNRSLFSESLFSEYTSVLTKAEREEVLNQFYYPHRSAVEQWIANTDRKVLHISVHTFTPVFQGLTRDVDIGLLFDPDRRSESIFCKRCMQALSDILPDLSIKFNEPYKGIDDGFTTYLRTIFSDERYLGVEIEINQKFNGTGMRDEIAEAFITAFAQIVK